MIAAEAYTVVRDEGEFAVVIGRGARYLGAETAVEHVAGHACYNDATLRHCQRHTHQFTPGKNFPAAARDVIATGAPGGVGFKRDPSLFLKTALAMKVRVGPDVHRFYEPTCN